MSQSTLSPAELEFRKLVSRLYWRKEDPDDWGAKDPNNGPRPLRIAATYAYWGRLSGLIIQIDGSPPKGSLCVLVDPVSYFSPLVYQVVYLGGRTSRTFPPESREFKIVERFVEELLSKGAVKSEKHGHI